MAGVKVRAACADDAAAIATIYAPYVTASVVSFETEAPDAAEIARRMDEGGRLYPWLVACGEDGAVLGYAYAGAFRPRPAYRFVVEDSVYVAPEAKGQGVGLMLMQALIAAAEAAGFRQIVAVIGDGRADSASVRLHEKLGFRHSGRLEGSGYKHGRWLDTVFMQLSLNGGATLPPDAASLPERRFREGLRGK
jgi:phosphinothricin acetyltransferase